MPAGGAEVTIEVKEAWLPGAYVTATLYRALDEKPQRMPGRAIGVDWLGLDTSGQTLKVALEAPAKVQARRRNLTVPVKICRPGAGEEARVTVAAVDVGILNLTRFESPQPEKWFHAQRRLGLEIRDLYGRLIDGMRAERGRLRSGGDGARRHEPQRQPAGRGAACALLRHRQGRRRRHRKVDFDLPDFNGTVRLMAVAWSGTQGRLAARPT